MLDVSVFLFLGLLPNGGDALPAAVRLIDLDGDGRLDRLHLGTDGSLAISLREGPRTFQRVPQELPRVEVSNVLAADLDEDGYRDLYLISPGSNVALRGDGAGRFFEATSELGLADPGRGLSAESLDLDQDGQLDLLLRNREGDVVFYGADGRFQRDPAMPVVATAPMPAVTEASGAAEDTPSAGGAAAGEGWRPRRLAPHGPSVGDVGAPRIVPGGGAPWTQAPEASLPTPTIDDVEPLIGTGCATSIRDATSGSCIRADSTPTLGRLLPLGPFFYVDPAGMVGINTTAPDADLTVVGASTTEGMLQISPAGGFNAGSAILELNEQEPAIHSDPCGFRFVYDGITNLLRLESACPLPTTRMIFDRDSARGGVFTDNVNSTSPAGPGAWKIGSTVSQSLGSGGLVKAACHVNGVAEIVNRQFNLLPGGSSITVTSTSPGQYEVDFGADVSGRFYQGTLGNESLGTPPAGGIAVTPRFGNANAVFVSTYDTSGTSVDNSFYLLIY